MNSTSTKLIRESLFGAGAMMAARNKTLVLSFYEHLFTTAPELRALFPADIALQAEKLERTLDLAIASLSNTDMLIEPLRDLGARHGQYGVKTSHYPVVIDVLVTTLAEAWGPRWTAAHEAAWREMLTFVTGTMMEGAEMRSAA